MFDKEKMGIYINNAYILGEEVDGSVLCLGRLINNNAAPAKERYSKTILFLILKNPQLML